MFRKTEAFCWFFRFKEKFSAGSTSRKTSKLREGTDLKPTKVPKTPLINYVHFWNICSLYVPFQSIIIECGGCLYLTNWLLNRPWLNHQMITVAFSFSGSEIDSPQLGLTPFDRVCRFITWNNPEQIGETRTITKELATCQSLGDRFSHCNKVLMVDPVLTVSSHNIVSSPLRSTSAPREYTSSPPGKKRLKTQVSSTMAWR